MAKREIREPNDNPKYGGMSTWKHPSGRATYVVNTGTGPQNIKPVMQGPTWGLRNIAKDKQAVLLVPEYRFDAPQMIGEKESGYKRQEAGIYVTEALRIDFVNVWHLNGKGGGGLIQVKNPIKVVDSVGKVEMQGEARDISFGDWKRSSGDWVMTINPAAFGEGILKGGYAINDAVVAAVVKEKK
jgi:hypothetical protein